MGKPRSRGMAFAAKAAFTRLAETTMQNANRTTGLACCLTAACLCAGAAQPVAPSSEPSMPVTAAGLRDWIGQMKDNRGLPYLIIDKRSARMWIYDRSGQLVESSAVLLGSAIGDDSVPGIGARPLAQIKPSERTTPAGRFYLEKGTNSEGEGVFWVDYDAAVSLHRVRPGAPGDRRLQRLASATASDNRISYGCVNVPIAVFNRSVHALFQQRGGYAYILPENSDIQHAFPFLTPLARRQDSKAKPAQPPPSWKLSP